MVRDFLAAPPPCLTLYILGLIRGRACSINAHSFPVSFMLIPSAV